VDRTSVGLLWRLSMAIMTLTCLVVGVVIGITVPFGRAGRGLTIGALIATVVAIAIALARLLRLRQPDHPLAALAPESFVPRAHLLVESSAAAFHRRRRAERVRQAERAAREAAGDDPQVAPERVKAGAEALLRLVYLAWDARDPRRLSTLMGPELLRAWTHALASNDAAGEHHRAHVRDGVRIDLVGLHADAAGAFAAVVLIEAELDLAVEAAGGPVAPSVVGKWGVPHRLCQYWTLAIGPDPLVVHAIEERDAGDHHLAEPIVAHA
jgi:predicted lipid-binding transport protein (Tim44 family)